jgi:dihydroorotase
VKKALPSLGNDQLVKLFAINPAEIFGLELPTIEVGSSAMLTLFKPDENWLLESAHLKSQSKNNAFVGTQLAAKPAGIIHHNHACL